MELEKPSVEERAISPSETNGEKPKKKWVSYLWDTFDKPPEERRLLFKLDAALLTFASLAYFVKHLDQVNINSAFVSGMKEDVGLYKDELNYMQACWTIGYVLGEVPSNLLLTRVRARYWLPATEIMWTILTFSLSKCNSAHQFYILRFFIGLTESTLYPGLQYIIGSWYRKSELAKRSCIFHTASGFACMLSGFLMAGVYKLDGVGGFKGWQWLFIIDGVISLPVALSGFFLLPDVPEISEPWYLTDREVALACQRMKEEGRRNREPYTKSKWKKIFSSWHIYCLLALYSAYNNVGGGQPTFQQYLKSSESPVYSVAEINTYATTPYAVQIVATLLFAWASDSFLDGRRWPPVLIAGAVNVLSFVPLAVWNIPTGLKWACYILSGLNAALGGLLMAWAQEICTDDNEERALVVASMNTFSNMVQAWLPLLVWKQTDAPRYQKGFITGTAVSVVMVVMAVIVRGLHHRENRERYAINENVRGKEQKADGAGC